MLLLAFSLASSAFASPAECRLVRVPGTESLGWLSLDGIAFAAAWSAVADCPSVPALDGRTFELTQDLDLTLRGRGTVGGTTWLTISSGDLSYTVDGTVHGVFDETAEALTLDLDVLAITDRVRVRVGAVIQFDSTDWDFVSFQPSDVEMSTMGS